MREQRMNAIPNTPFYCEDILSQLDNYNRPSETHQQTYWHNKTERDDTETFIMQ